MLEKLHKMMISGEITPYLYEYCLARIGGLPNDMQEQMLKEASIMSDVDVSSEDDHKHFLYITMHLKSIANDIASRPLSNDELAKVSSFVYINRVTYPIDTIFNFYKATDRALRNLNLPIKKVAYPIGTGGVGGVMPDPPRDVSRWMQAMRDTYARVHRGLGFNEAFDKVTANWDTMEKQDFKAWQRYYTEGAQDKYKTAQTSNYYQAEDGSPLLPFGDLRSELRSAPSDDLPEHIVNEKQKKKEEQDAADAERQAIIEDARRKLISRLTSAERLATSVARDDLNQAMDMGLEKWLEMLHKLKRSIQTAPMRSSSSPILYDLIIRQSNQLSSQGYVKTGKLLMSLAQGAPEAPPVSEMAPASEMPPEEPTDEMTDEPGDLGGLGLADMPEVDEESGAMDDFIRMLNHEHLDDDSESDDSGSDDELVVEAQGMPEPPPEMAQEPELPMNELVEGDDVIEVSDPPEQGDTTEWGADNPTIESVIERLELVANIIQNREIPRQLSMADIDMGKLGIATFFPNLGESIRSALESHQYIYTRVEDIIAKLRGSVQPAQPIDLVSDETSEDATSETLDAVRQNLTESEDRDKQRSEERKAKREAREQVPEEPEAPPITPEEIAGPVEVESAPPTRAT